MAVILVTGTAGFIGNEVALKLLERGDEVIGIDSVNDYYEVALKRARLARLSDHPGYRHHEFCLADAPALNEVFRRHAPRRVIHLAAQAGVRYSLERPDTYISANLVGFANLLEACRHHEVEHLVYASSSSVYGANTRQPFRETDPVNHPVSLYAATKKSNELMAHTYSHLFDLPTTGLRFFTVYGPWGRPDMAYFKFARNIVEGRPIEVYNHGNHQRDFTYIDDIVHGVVASCDAPATPNPEWDSDHPDPASSRAPWRLYNIGNNQPVELMYFIGLLEQHLGRAAEKIMLPMQPGDVVRTYADVDALGAAVHYRPDTPIETGVARFIDWFCDYYDIDRG